MGYCCRKNVNELIKMGKKSSKQQFYKKELLMGINVELEHTKSRKIAAKIAKDHLEEMPRYYTHLRAMEKRFSKKKGK